MIGQIEEVQDRMNIEWESLDNQIKLTDFSEDDMDVDFDSIVDTMMTHNVSLNAAVKAKDISVLLVSMVIDESDEEM